MTLKDVLYYALTQQALTGCAFDRDALDPGVAEVFEANGVDVDAVVDEVENGDDSFFDMC